MLCPTRPEIKPAANQFKGKSIFTFYLIGNYNRAILRDCSGNGIGTPYRLREPSEPPRLEYRSYFVPRYKDQVENGSRIYAKRILIE